MPTKFNHPLLSSFNTCANPDCGKSFEVAATGRKRKFCSDSCRNADWKKSSRSAVIQEYEVLCRDFFALRSAKQKQARLDQWAKAYALYLNGDLPSFHTAKEALLSKQLVRPKFDFEEGRDVRSRLIATLNKLVPGKDIFKDHLAVVQAFPDITPSPELLAQKEATETPAPSKPVERSQKPSEPASLIHAPKPAKPVQPAPVEADEDAELLAAFSEFFGDDSDRKEPAPVACEETRPAPIKINPSYAACVKMSFDKIGDIREDFLFRKFEEYDYPLKATLSAMVEEGSIIKTKKAEGVFYRIANNEANEKADFWAECLRYAKGDMTKARTSFRNVFDLWPSKEIQETSVDLSIEPGVANVRRIEEGRKRYFDEKKKAA